MALDSKLSLQEKRIFNVYYERELHVSVIPISLNIIHYQCARAWRKNYMYQSHTDMYSKVSVDYYATTTPNCCTVIIV